MEWYAHEYSGAHSRDTTVDITNTQSRNGTEMNSRIKVVYIVGAHRSGSTLLDRLLGQVDGFFSTGELANIWDRGIADNHLCGCGKPHRECEFWNAVMEDAFGGADRVSIGESDLFALRLEHIRNTPILAIPMLRNTSQLKRRIDAYSQILYELFRAIKKISGSRVIVDSSKLAGRALILSWMPDVDLHVIHLVRDSRAIVHSWKRAKRRPEIHWTAEYMPVTGTVRASLRWNMYNMLVHVGRFGSYKLIHYENLVAEPQTTLSQIIKMTGETASLDFFVTNRLARLERSHTVSGNPMRFQAGFTEIRIDDEWQVKMSSRRKLLVTLLTWPLLLKYGFGLSINTTVAPIQL
jgi:hypothetical protein